MKLLCPHCGVKGSAEDSYSGRKVKCPKCQGLFELKPEMALKLPEDSTLVSELSSTPVESPAPLGEFETPITADNGLGEARVDEAIAVEEFERSVELNVEPMEPELEPTPLLKEEALDLEDVASEIDLQLAEDELGEESDETLQGTPAESSSLEDEFATPADDLGLTVEEESAIGEATGEDIWDEVEENPAETEVTELMEESSLLDSVDSPSLEQEIEDDLDEPAAIVENSEEADSIAIEEFERSVEPNGEPAESELESTPLLKEEALDWEDVASEIDLQLAEGELDEESDEILQDKGETLDAQELSAGGSGLSDDAINESDNKSHRGNAIRKAWAKIKAIWR